MSKEQGSESAVSGSELIKEEEMAEEKEAPKKLSRMEFVKGAAVGVAAAAGAGALAGCANPQGEVGAEGPVGPAGPAGPAGPQGAPAIPVIAEKELTCDVLVVGGGTSGFTAAVKAAQAGAKTIVIEKNPEIGGEGMVSGNNATLGGGTDYQKEAGIEDSPELFYEELLAWDPKAKPELLKAYADNSVALCHFLRDLGVEFSFAPKPSLETGASVGRLTSVVGGGPALYEVMRPAFEDAGGTILTETKAIRLLTDAAGTVVGVLARDNEGSFEIKSKATLLTCGGFQANVEMMTKYAGPDSVYALMRGLPTNSGDGVLLGMEVGASTEAMHRLHGYVHVPPYPIPYPLRPYASAITPDGKGATMPGMIGSAFAYGIVVNIRGERFTDETRERKREQMCNELAKQPEAIGYSISDTTVYDEFLKASVETAIEAWQALGYGAPRIETADTIEDLAEKIGVNPSLLSSTVSEYNKAVDEGTTHLLNPPKANPDPHGFYEERGMNYLQKIVTPPFYAVLIISGISHTHGGLDINGKCQVLDTEKRVIPGLYAAGDTAVMYHSNYAGDYAVAHTQGYIAGDNAAAEVLAS
jgi:succinate dehydrogenase/fumarate reductase flavoprotein subunit